MKFPHLLGRVTVAIGIALGSLAAQATEFRSSDIHPDDYPTVLAVRHMGEELAKATGGKHSIKVFSKGALGIEKDTIEQTKLGAIAMTRVNVAPMNNICPATMVPTMPFLFRDKEHMRKVLDGAIGDEILKDCESQGFVGLAFLRQRRALHLHRQEACEDPGRRQGHESARAAKRPVGLAARSHGR